MKPKQGEVNPSWMLHFAYAPFSMTGDVMPSTFVIVNALFRHSEHFFFVIPSGSEESSMDASLRSA